ncbi:unnamed protein product, partial [Choristocarpus tenellus]
MNRLCLALAAVAVRAPDGVEAYLREAFALSQVSGFTPGIGPAAGGVQAASAVSLTLEMLKLLPQEVEGADLSRARRLELQDRIRQCTSSILQALESVMTTACGQPLGVGTQNGGGGAAGGPWGEEVALAALDCLQEWVKLGVSLGALATDRAVLLALLVKLMAGEGVGQGDGVAAAVAALPKACKACEVVAELVGVREFPRPAARPAAAEALLEAMGRMPGLFAAAIQTEDEGACAKMCNTLVTFAQAEMELVVGLHGKGLPFVE